ncbi:NUDIX hydrolase [Candidatus Woesearchaeota archaeon]|nr:NUDIX hydrolase [Candidatus Woesearchaeota archaeon]
MTKKLILSGCLVVNDNKEVLLLYKKNHKHYETPGGKLDPEDCSVPNQCTVDDLAKTARRELFEELGDDIEVEPLKFFDKIEFTIPDGRKAVANKFLTRIIKGKPRNNEPETFDRIDYLPIEKIEEYPISPDLKLLTSRLKERLL